jgi:hypothetical protein
VRYARRDVPFRARTRGKKSQKHVKKPCTGRSRTRFAFSRPHRRALRATGRPVPSQDARKQKVKNTGSPRPRTNPTQRERKKAVVPTNKKTHTSRRRRWRPTPPARATARPFASFAPRDPYSPHPPLSAG